jgi:hypothetical protein
VTEHLGVRMTLLDAQIVDCDRLPIGRVDDLELRFPGDEAPPEIARILTGSQALGDRIGGVIGRWMSSISARLRGPAARPGPSSLDARLITDIEPMVRLSVQADELEDIAGLEHWLASTFVERLPGTGRADK